jgi:hypothetical protein
VVGGSLSAARWAIVVRKHDCPRLSLTPHRISRLYPEMREGIRMSRLKGLLHMSSKLETGAWRKAKASGMGNCVEVRTALGRVDIRDSKNPHVGHLSMPPAVFQTWIDSLKASPPQ